MKVEHFRVSIIKLRELEIFVGVDGIHNVDFTANINYPHISIYMMGSSNCDIQQKIIDLIGGFKIKQRDIMDISRITFYLGGTWVANQNIMINGDIAVDGLHIANEVNRLHRNAYLGSICMLRPWHIQFWQQ